MMKVNSEELAVVGFDNNGNWNIAGGQLVAKEGKEYFKHLRENLMR